MSGASFQSLMATVSSGGGGGGSDPDFASVVLLMGFESGLIDESSAVHGTASGTGTQSSTKAKFGANSLACLGNSIQYADSTDWQLGSGHFTLEAWVNLNGDINSANHFILSQYFGSGTLGWALWVNPSHQLSWNISTTGSDNINDITGSTTLSFNTWYHVCIDYDGTKYRAYVNGVMDGSSTTPRTIFFPSSNLGIGANSNSSSFWLDGYLDELRITKGVARYASDSGFTAPTAAFPRS